MTAGGSVPRRIAVFASGGGSNLGALLAYFSGPAAQVAYVAAVVSDRPGAGALARAAAAGVAHHVLPDPCDGAALDAVLRREAIDLVFLAGYLKLVPDVVTSRFAGQIVNVHPALLPRHGGAGMHGMRVHRAVLAAGDAESGATVHFVDAEYDRGAPIAWARVPVRAGDTPESLAARVLVGEHFVLPRVIHALALGVIRFTADGRVEVDSGAASLFSGPPPDVTISLAG